MRPRTRKICAIVSVVMLAAGMGAIVGWLMAPRDAPVPEGEHRIYLVDVFHWGFLTSAASHPEMAVNHLTKDGMPTTTLRANVYDEITIIFRNAESVQELREQYRQYTERALSRANLTMSEWSALSGKSPMLAGHVIVLDGYCGAITMSPSDYEVIVTFQADGVGKLGFRSLSTLGTLQMSGQILIGAGGDR